MKEPGVQVQQKVTVCPEAFAKPFLLHHNLEHDGTPLTGQSRYQCQLCRPQYVSHNPEGEALDTVSYDTQMSTP